MAQEGEAVAQNTDDSDNGTAPFTVLFRVTGTVVNMHDQLSYV